MSCRGVRGATTVPANTSEAILASTRELLGELVAANALEPGNVASALFTVSPDLNAEYPAAAARQMGWTHVALMCAVEIDKPGALRRCVRVLLHVNTELSQEDVRHVYLHGARALRPDLEA